MTTPTRASRFIRVGLAALAVVVLMPFTAAAQSAGRPALQRVAVPLVSASPLRQRPQTVVRKLIGDPVGIYQHDNAHSVPFIGAPQAWQGLPGLHGEHVRVAVIDTGVDYTHANFGGPGTVAAYNAAFASSTLPADPTLFGPDAPKVK